MIRSVFLAVVLIFVGCQSEHPDESMPSPNHESIVTEPKTGSSLSVVIDQQEYDLTEVVRVRATLRWLPGVHTELIAPDWNSLGWELEHNVVGTTAFDGTTFRQTYEFSLSPFLGGVYSVEGFGIRASSEVTGKRIARLAPLNVRIDSVLTETDGPDIEASLEFAGIIETRSDQPTLWLVALGIGATLSIAASVIWIRYRKSPTLPLEVRPQDVFSSTAKSKSISEADLGKLHAALIDLTDEHDVYKELLWAVESIRFSGTMRNPDLIRSIAKRASDICCEIV